MPIYEYECESCGAVREVLVRSIQESASEPSCPACGAKGMRKLLSTFGVGRGSEASGACPADGGPPCSPAG